LSAPAHLPEAARNALLRRVDWRFLVQQEGEPRTLSPAGGSRERALGLVSAPATDGVAPDLVVLVDPDARSLAAAVTRLAPGGTLYAEWHRPQLGGRQRLERRLAAAGLEAPRWYWPWPPPGRGPWFWLPIDSPEALAYFLAQRRRAAGPRRRLHAAGWPLQLRARILVPRCAVARKPGGSPDAVETAVRLHSGGDASSWILLSGGRRSINKVVGIPVVTASAGPKVVVKFARSAAEEELLRHESHMLRQLAEARPELAGVPKALFLERRCGRLALGESALDGEPAVWQLDGDRFGAVCDSVTDWLVGLARGAELHRGTSWRERLVEEPLARFARDYAAVVSPDEIAGARTALSTLGDLPAVFEQRDCAPWNILLERGRVSVADWESAEPAGLPALDLVYFLTTGALLLAGALDQGPIAQWYSDSLDPHSRVGRVVARCESSYCERVGVDAGLLPALRLLCWTIHARSEFLRFELDVAGQPPPPLLATSRFLALWRVELRRQTS
jgi:hypothetical protein